MSNFSELLTAFSKRAGINSPQIASYCNLDRVTVYRFMKGKTLPKDKQTVNKMAEILQLTCDEKKYLTEAYDSTKLGPRIYWQRRYIRSFMRYFSGKASIMPVLQYDTEDVEDSDRETLLVSGRDNVVRRIQKEILRECERQHPSISLIMRPGVGPVMDMLLSAGKRNMTLQVKHLIPVTNTFLSGNHESIPYRDSSLSFMDNMSFATENGPHSPFRMEIDPSGISDFLTPYDEWISRGGDYELLQNFFRVASMCAEGFDYQPSYFYTRHVEIDQFPIYSNLLLTGDHAVLFADDLREAILFQAPDQVASLEEKFERSLAGKPVLAHVFRDIEPFMENMNRVFVNRTTNREEKEYYYTSLPCLLPFLTDAIIRNHMTVDALPIPENRRHEIVDSLYEYIQAMRNKYENEDLNQIDYVPVSGFRYFLKTGRFGEVPPELYTPLTESERREMLLKLADHPNFKIQLLKRELSAPEGMLCVEVLENLLFLEFLVPGRGICFLYFNEPGIQMAFRSFFSTFPDEDVYSEEESREIIRRLARE